MRSESDHHFEPFSFHKGEEIGLGATADRIAQRTAKEFYHLVFFQFVPKGTQHLTEAQRWAKHYGIPALADVLTDPGEADLSDA